MNINRLVRRGIGPIALLSAAGCCGGLKNAVRDEAKSIHVTTQPTIQLIAACKGGNQAACDAATSNVQAIDQAASQLENDSK